MTFAQDDHRSQDLLAAWIGQPDRVRLLYADPCPADFNNSGAVGVQDLFDFLGAWFARLPAADSNGSGAVTVQDLFDFLAVWFAGCH